METLKKKLKRHLTPEEIYTILEIISECHSIYSEHALKNLIRTKLGLLLDTEVYNHALIHNKKMDLSLDELYFNISTYPNEWLERYIQRRYEELDPTIPFVLQEKNKAISWEDAYRWRNPPKDFIGEAATFGLTKGNIVSTVSPTPPLNRSIFTLAGNEDNGRSKLILEVLISHLHAAIEQVNSTEKTALLTKRERDILALTEQDYSRDDIAFMLSISRSTVNFHWKNIFDKLHIQSASSAEFRRFRYGIVVDDF